MHAYSRVLFPSAREARFVRRHRGLGHKVTHHGKPEMQARCYWRCSCGERYSC